MFGFAAMSSTLLLAALALSSALSIPTAIAQTNNSAPTTNGMMPSSSSDTMAMSNNTNNPIQISSNPIAVGHYNTTSQQFGNQSLQISFEGNTMITLPNSTNQIMAKTTGNVTIYFTSAGGFLHGHGILTTPGGNENATLTVTELLTSENGPNRGIAAFSTNSTGQLAAINGKTALVWDVNEPDGSTTVSFYEWKSGPM